ncbi:bifunctional alpha/beta hydrolase/OsmC family protein [Legionella spiritensis]|uniref:Alpha/beta superfamily hydrolase n=1 Tax=Legionella spiritensis TaxID=452 RepID=A0A0W0Z9B7_LEGSP|nr:bifunctional alpha/beta hydrolase/OsmC family protein [Legionella spiritensis]KTD65725.1 alpha/beta superfamily hydrolase [Legionella spiritensis]SNV43257.1 alpha/beta superfamily hydrolase [Legionella spiritensis]
MKQNIEFESQGVTLRGVLELPESDCVSYALFAHCFTCGKDISAASRIARALVEHGIGVLRFDFTGLGNSEGDFANSNFSSNVQDLIAAADFLREKYAAPKLLIGHSLGGTAIVLAAQQIREAVAVVTIGAPSTPEHVQHHFGLSLDQIEQKGLARVTLGIREFTIKKQFLDDIRQYKETIQDKTHNALLIMHSPLDAVVPIQEAEKIYRIAKHPKSFISLDTADHLLSNKEDAQYAATVIAAWAERYMKNAQKQANPGLAKGHVLVSENDHRFLQTVSSDDHTWLADEPAKVGGTNKGPDPYEHLLAALGACTSMTLRMYADRKKWPLDNVTVELQHSREHSKDCEHCLDASSQIDHIQRTIRLEGELSQEQIERLTEIANLCPVHKTLHGVIVDTSVE